MGSHSEICTWLIILLTSLVSVLAFRSDKLLAQYIFEPERILAWKEYYRVVTSAFLHADWTHLALNMITLYFFGGTVESAVGPAQFLTIYFGAVVGGGLLSLYIHRHHEYRAYGASGGVCGIIFAYLLLFPGAYVSAFPLPFFVPGWLYAIGFLGGSFYAIRAERGNIGHDAHLGGAILGLLITACLQPAMARENSKVLFIVSLSGILVLIYLWRNPVLLPAADAAPGRWRFKTGKTPLPQYRQEELHVDELLQKIDRSGMESLTLEEKQFLEEVSAKYQRRADSKKPESGLAI